MFIKKKLDYKLAALFLILVGVCFYFMMVFSPLYADDYLDSFLWGTNHKLNTIGDYLHNLYLHYLLVSARVIPHFFIEFFSVFLGKSFFNVLNAFTFVVFLYLLTRYSLLFAPNKSILFSQTLCFATSLVFLLMPGFSQVFLWASGACNYLWIGVLLLWFLLLLEHKETQSSGIWLFLFGFICGWTNEAFVFGLGAGLFLHYLIFRQELTRGRLCLLSGFFSGFLFLAFSPISIHRFTDGISVERNYLHQLVSALLAMDNLRCLPLLLILILLFAVSHHLPKRFFKDNDILFLSIGFSFIFVLITNFSSARSRFGIEFFSLILILRLLAPLFVKRKVLLCSISSACIFCIVIPSLLFSYRNNQEYQSCLEQIQRENSFIIQTEEPEIPSFFERLVLRFIPSEKSESYHGFLGNYWIEYFYGKDNLCFLPKRFLDLASSNNLSSDFDVHTEFPFYSKTVDPNIVVNKIQFHLAPTKPHSVPLLLRPFMKKFERWNANEVVAEKWRIITLPSGQTVLLVGKNPMVADRVSSISVL